MNTIYTAKFSESPSKLPEVASEMIQVPGFFCISGTEPWDLIAVSLRDKLISEAVHINQSNTTNTGTNTSDRMLWNEMKMKSKSCMFGVEALQRVCDLRLLSFNKDSLDIFAPLQPQWDVMHWVLQPAREIKDHSSRFVALPASSQVTIHIQGAMTSQ